MADPTTMAPVEIDRILSAIAEKRGRVAATIARCERKSSHPNRPGPDNRATLKDARAKIARLDAEASPFEAEYARRPWSRYFRVTNAGGHVHRGLHCSTCFRSTQYVWVLDLADCDETEMVEVYGELACTVCFPAAPVMVGYGDGASYVAKMTDEAKAAKATAKAAKAAKVVYRLDRPEDVWFKTERGAELEAAYELAMAIERQYAVDHGRALGTNYASLIASGIAAGTRIVSALAAKHGVSIDDELDRLRPAIWRKAARDIKEMWGN